MELAEPGNVRRLELTEEQASVLRRVLEYWYPFVDDDPPLGSDEYVVKEITALLTTGPVAA